MPHDAAIVLAGGLIAGALDILYAIVFWAVKANVPAQRILQSVAAGVLGRESFNGGWQSALLGLVLHFFIAVTMAFVYYMVALRRPMLYREPFRCAVIYGLILYSTMQYLVVPLSRAAPGAKDPLWIALSVTVHIFFIALPIALATRRALTRNVAR